MLWANATQSPSLDGTTRAQRISAASIAFIPPSAPTLLARAARRKEPSDTAFQGGLSLVCSFSGSIQAIAKSRATNTQYGRQWKPDLAFEEQRSHQTRKSARWVVKSSQIVGNIDARTEKVGESRRQSDYAGNRKQSASGSKTCAPTSGHIPRGSSKCELRLPPKPVLLRSIHRAHS